jgi:hypothetical protein
MTVFFFFLISAAVNTKVCNRQKCRRRIQEISMGLVLKSFSRKIVSLVNSVSGSLSLSLSL